jgi:hypothetical protein
VETWEWIATGAAIGAGALLIVVLLSAFVMRRRRRKRLKQRFGPEYFRAVSATGRRRAERTLAQVEHEREDMQIHGLPAIARERYLEEWRQAEARFVSDPSDAARAAERIVLRVLQERGYPTDGDENEQAAHLAVDYPEVADRYRHAEELLGDGNGGSQTEDLRRAMVDFRGVLEELLVREPATVHAHEKD